MRPLPIADRPREQWPADKGTGGFSKPASPVCVTIDEAIARCSCPTYGGDFLVRSAPAGPRCGWQVWMRRANARGVSYPGDYEFLPTGRRAKKRKAGAGRLFICEAADM